MYLTILLVSAVACLWAVAVAEDSKQVEKAKQIISNKQKTEVRVVQEQKDNLHIGTFTASDEQNWSERLAGISSPKTLNQKWGKSSKSHNEKANPWWLEWLMFQNKPSLWTATTLLQVEN